MTALAGAVIFCPWITLWEGEEREVRLISRRSDFPTEINSNFALSSIANRRLIRVQLPQAHLDGLSSVPLASAGVVAEDKVIELPTDLWITNEPRAETTLQDSAFSPISCLRWTRPGHRGELFQRKGGAVSEETAESQSQVLNLRLPWHYHASYGNLSERWLLLSRGPHHHSFIDTSWTPTSIYLIDWPLSLKTPKGITPCRGVHRQVGGCWAWSITGIKDK